ncbi:MAG: protease FtsH-inhibitory lysogeny factor CIII [Symbiopectobacterium sp.]
MQYAFAVWPIAGRSESLLERIINIIKAAAKWLKDMLNQ